MTPSNHNLVETGCGQRLRAAREAAGLDIAEVAARLKMPVHIVEAIESEDWVRLGAPVFIRGQLRSYSRLLGLPMDPVQMASAAAPIEPTRLVPRIHTPRLQRVADQVGGRLVYAVITALLILPVWVATRSHMDNLQDAAPLDLPAGKLAINQAQPLVPVAKEPSTVVASMASLPARQGVVSPLALTFSGDSWVQVVAPDGHDIEKALLKAGETRSYAAGEVGHMVLGNATSVELRTSGHSQDLSPYMRANVARFTVSSDGSLAPVSD